MSKAKSKAQQTTVTENAMSAFLFEENPAGLIREMYKSVKGIEDCKVCIPFTHKPSDNLFSEGCMHCMFSENPMLYSCILREGSEFKTLVISTTSKKYGHIVLKINSEFSMNTIPLLQHLANTAALALENQIQKKVFEKMNLSSKQYNDKLIAQNNVKDKLISIIAHDLKSPFTALHTSCELLRHQLFTFDVEKIKKHSDTIYYSSKNAYKLLNDLLSWSRLHSGHIKVNKDKISLYDKILEILQGLKEAASEKEIEIEIKINGDRESVGFFDN
ncbi:MAG: histidine kinase dimerization/phospho-acceptor domain-containing protein [Bacteroidota bacterium]